MPPVRHRLPSIAPTLIAALTAALAACNEAPKTVAPFAEAIGATEAIRFRIGDRKLFVQARVMDRELRTSQRVEVREGDRLSFVPVLQTDPEGDTRCELYGRAQGEERRLGSWSPLVLDELAAGEGTRADYEPPSVDLAAFRGDAIELRWRWTRDVADEGAFLLRPRLGRTRTKARPDILFICSDTHRYDHASGPLGAELMPTLTTLAEGAVTYSEAYSTASWTLPSIASTLTGLFPRRHGTGLRHPELKAQLDEDAELPPGYFGAMRGRGGIVFSAYPDRLPTFTERLQQADYTTAMIVSNPLYLTSSLYADGQDLTINAGVIRGEEINRAAEQLLEFRSADAPIFLMVHYMDAHQWQPWNFDLTNSGRPNREDLAPVYAAYRETIRTTDANLHELLELWRSRVNAEESLIVFYSDHGESLFDEGRLGHGDSMAEELLHVPLVVRYPASQEVSPGVVETPVALIDLYPTLLHLLDLPPTDAHLDGRSLLESAGEARPFHADYQLYGTEYSSLRLGGSKLTFDLDAAEQSYEQVESNSNANASEVELERIYARYLETSTELTRGLRSDAVIESGLAAQALGDLGYLGTGEEEDED